MIIKIREVDSGLGMTYTRDRQRIMENTMTDMPEKIWAWHFAEGSKNEVMHGGWTPEIDRREVEYIRADIAQAQLDEKDAEIARLREASVLQKTSAMTAK